jgi:hypothetical protein
LTKLLATHAPHIAFVLAGVVAFFWTAYRKPAGSARAQTPVPEPVSPVRPPASNAPLPVARRALVALGPLMGALATGAVLYGVNIGGDRVPGGLIWVHAGVSLLAMVLVVYKVAAVRRARVRLGVSRGRLPVIISVVLGSLFVPLLITGIELLIAPRSGSFAAYGHLVASAWWTGMLTWHLRRYLRPALRAALGRPADAPVAVALDPEASVEPS